MGDTANTESAKAPVFVDGASLGVLEAIPDGTTDIWDGWSVEDRARVEQFVAAGRAQLQATEKDHGVLFSPDERAGAVLQSAFNELVDDGVVDFVTLDTGLREARVDNHDIRWTRTLFGLVLEKLKIGRFDWCPPSLTPDRIANNCRIAIMGDWGSGLYGAPVCASSISTDAVCPDAIVHLGDIYYSGSEKEVQQNFLDPWPSAAMNGAGTTMSRACNGNHEMYSRGKPYAEQILPSFRQQSSVFAIENDAWLLVGLDTAYDEWQLLQGQLEWLKLLLTRDDDRRVILFSHHQPFSHFAASKGNLHDRIGQVVEEFPNKLHTWYWGHEHLGAIYDEYHPWKMFGRCIGHSGFPYFRRNDLEQLPRRDPVDSASNARLIEVPAASAPRALVVDGPNVYMGDAGPDRYGPNGYLTLDLRDREMQEALRSPDGHIVWQTA
jgi:3',5'-cyclic AMP phosphodiesterase CpdA